jgi:D-alanine-D-alanine ligase-like ATP-grasp enzyme
MQNIIQKNSKIAVLCGGMSSEREISLRSGKNVLAALHRLGYLNAQIVDVTENIIVVFSFNDNEMKKALELQAEGNNRKIDVIIIDCNKENKVSASNAKEE